ncbi:hypothetical protein [Mucilaginibacter sp. FT3.2]|uniref:hypothetical protein n=1 Tax=Mucilaginibacter sp. FT3.2 TaxID=2723090 RepID=UPI00161E8150|nr:hypothetical protein [Mucilaginibacter sp. FT3.2]MBB6231990.1 hypothetical protein [Mucilaginibacter sp. FT3.2]
MKPGPIFLLSTVCCIILSGCWEKRSNDAEESYTLWLGEKPGKEVLAIHGKYWQSSHFTREYIAYLELAPSQLWTTKFIKQNQLIKTSDNLSVPTDAPVWFMVPHDANKWKSKTGNDSWIIEDRKTHRVFIYEEQL